MKVIGLISGTSFDGIDVAVADLAIDGDTFLLRLLGDGSLPYAADLRAAIAEALPPAGTTADALCVLDTLIGQAFAEAAAHANERFAQGSADLVVSHGQTLYHWVSGRRALGTLQLGQPAWIAERTGLPVVADLRARDVAAGGHGAPLVSFLDVLLLSDGQRDRRAALNLGGIANLTVVGPDLRPLAFDTGPANALIDAAVVRYSDGRETFDEGGRRARHGSVDDQLLARLLADPYYALDAPKSTGKEHFNDGYLQKMLEGGTATAPDDVVATLTALTARVVADDCRRLGVTEVVAAGGGTRNPTLMGMLREELGAVPVALVDDYGIPADAKEAYAFALLGFATLHGLPATLPSCTGASHPSVLGHLVPGAGPLTLPPTPPRPPTRLRVLGKGGA